MGVALLGGRVMVTQQQGVASLVPRPRPVFRHLQYGKATESWAGPGNEAKE